MGGPLFNESVSGIDDGIGFGVAGRSNRFAGIGVYGDSRTGDALRGFSDSGNGVRGLSYEQSGIRGSSYGGAGVYGDSREAEGVHGMRIGGVGVVGESDLYFGVTGYSKTGTGVFGQGKYTGVVGFSYDGHGMIGDSREAEGVHGMSIGGVGVAGESESGTAVQGISTNLIGVAGYSRSNTAVFGWSDSGYGVHARSNTGLAAFLRGNVEVTGDIRVSGADCAEEFDTSGADKVEPGTVMVLSSSEGTSEVSSKAYDKRVAGVASGAGGFKPGIVLDKKQVQEESNENKRRMPIALMGKVYCKVDADYSPIEVGDLLTTSSTKGYAMKADDPMKAFGAVIGKALGSVKQGLGMIPVLVTLQ